MVMENEVQVSISNVKIYNNHATNKGGVANIIQSNLLVLSTSNIKF